MSSLRAGPDVSIKKVRRQRKRGETLEVASCRQQMPLICSKINLTGKRAEFIPRSFKGGPCEFINLLSCVYLTEYIIHTGTSFNLLIRGQLVFLRLHPMKLFFLRQTNTSWFSFFLRRRFHIRKISRTALFHCDSIIDSTTLT